MTKEKKRGKLAKAFNKARYLKTLGRYLRRKLAFRFRLRVMGEARQFVYPPTLLDTDSSLPFKVTVLIPVKETFILPLLEDRQHIDRASIDALCLWCRNFLGIIVGRNEEYCRIYDSIFASMGQVSKEKLVEDKKAARQAS